jgi:hypothetical protein
MLTHLKKKCPNKNSFLKIICLTTLMLGGVAVAMNTDDQQKKLNKQLWKAVNTGNIDEVAQLLNKGANPNAEKASYRNESMLLKSTMLGNVEICRLLIEKGANVTNSMNNWDATPLKAAAGGLRAIGRGSNEHFGPIEAKELSILLIDAMLKAPMSQTLLKPIHLTPQQRNEIYALVRSLKNTPIKGLSHDTRKLIIEDVRNRFKRRNFIEAQIMATRDPLKQELLDYLNSRIEQQIKEGPQMMKKK